MSKSHKRNIGIAISVVLFAVPFLVIYSSLPIAELFRVLINLFWNSQLPVILLVSCFLVAVFNYFWLRIGRSKPSSELLYDLSKSIISFCIGLLIPILFRSFILKDDETHNEAIWKVIDLLSGMLFVFLEKIHGLLTSIYKKHKSNVKDISIALAGKLNAENSIAKVVFKQNYHLKEYFENLKKLHDLVNEKASDVNLPPSFTFKMLNASTENLYKFFEGKSVGVYDVYRAIELYEHIAVKSKSLIVFEPNCPLVYETHFTDKYITFIERYGATFEKTIDFYFIRAERNERTVNWLANNNIWVKSKDMPELNEANRHGWEIFSHLIFDLGKIKVCCSVLPFSIVNFQNAKNVYLAYRLLNTAGPSDELTRYLDDLLARSDKAFE